MIRCVRWPQVCEFLSPEGEAVVLAARRCRSSPASRTSWVPGAPPSSTPTWRCCCACRVPRGYVTRCSGRRRRCVRGRLTAQGQGQRQPRSHLLVCYRYKAGGPGLGLAITYSQRRHQYRSCYCVVWCRWWGWAPPVAAWRRRRGRPWWRARAAPNWRRRCRWRRLDWPRGCGRRWTQRGHWSRCVRAVLRR